MTLEDHNSFSYLSTAELSEAIPTALAQFNTLTSEEGIAHETERLHDTMAPFLDENSLWDTSKANAFYKFLIQKGIEYEELGNQDGLAMTQAVRGQFHLTEDDYRRYLDLLQSKPHVGIRIDDPRGQTILQAGEAVPRPSQSQIFIPNSNRRFMEAYQNQTCRLFMKDINTLYPRTVSVAVDRIVAASAPFDSWTSGYSAGNKREQGSRVERNSADLIKEYALRPSEIPPLDQVRGLITRDGALYYHVTGGAHRAAAAIMKGQRRIPTKEIVFQPINMSSADIECYTSNE